MGSIPGITPQSGAGGASNDSSSGATGSNSMSNTAAFLQLLVAQLKNQDPTNPVDPTTFVTQLAEFNDVQQNLGTRQDLDAMSMQYLGLTTPPSGGTGDSSTNATNGSSGAGSSGDGSSS